MTLVQLKRNSTTPAASVGEYSVRRDDLAQEPTEGRERRINVERHGELFLASDPAVGALSVVDERDLIALHLLCQHRAEPEAAHAAVRGFYDSLCENADDAVSLAQALVDRFTVDGWMRETMPRPESQPLHTIYFTVTRRCDLACPYCYQGLANRKRTEMTLEQAELALDKIKAVNPHCKLIITGGEPFSHPRIFDILDAADAREFGIVILTNGTYIDSETAARLKALTNLLHVQVSLDGLSPETHALTRGKGHFPKVMRAIESIIEHELPFVLAPTMHGENLHELYDIAALAIANGGWCSPNNLREFPHEGLNFDRVQLSNEDCLRVLADMNTRLLETFGLARMAELAGRFKTPSVCSVSEPNSTFICGMAHSLMDLDWNGDLYPCHLTKDEKLILGNLYVDEFDEVFARVEERGLRVHSHEMPKCSGCKFVSTCGGGCRAGAWFSYGSLAREDVLCDLNHNSQLRRVLISAGQNYPSVHNGL